MIVHTFLLCEGRHVPTENYKYRGNGMLSKIDAYQCQSVTLISRMPNLWIADFKIREDIFEEAFSGVARGVQVKNPPEMGKLL